MSVRETNILLVGSDKFVSSARLTSPSKKYYVQSFDSDLLLIIAPHTRGKSSQKQYAEVLLRWTNVNKKYRLRFTPHALSKNLNNLNYGK